MQLRRIRLYLFVLVPRKKASLAFTQFVYKGVAVNLSFNKNLCAAHCGSSAVSVIALSPELNVCVRRKEKQAGNGMENYPRTHRSGRRADGNDR